ncbi:MAG: tRNA guanosine(34) transglycosylase Tgt [Myxococcales bacterium]|nr:tRNA guanosine(34) transglycosylase Tgt [Myxococcales bacterium]
MHKVLPPGVAAHRPCGYNPRVRFRVEATAAGTRARAGTLTTARSEILTPVFMPVGTRAAVRSQNLGQLQQLGAQIILGNTYHLMVRPGIELFERLGGLHKWMRWDKSILTDSGGFQIFSLPHIRAMSEDGATFRSQLDGTVFHLTPERSVAMQLAIGSDIMMVLDQCINSTSPHGEAKAAMELTHRWAARSLAARGDAASALFAIVQGACFADLRRQSAAALTDMTGFDGYAIGGLAVGESKAEREDIAEMTADLLPRDKPRYLMGVGTPIDLLEGVHRGVDMFDCILPTAWAQQGTVFSSRGKLDLRRGVHKFDEAPLDEACACDACVLYGRSYLHHLVKCKEPLGWQLLANHNLHFYLGLMAKMRGHIIAGTFPAFYAEQREVLMRTDEDNPPLRAEPKKSRHRGAEALGNFRVHIARGGDHGDVAGSSAGPGVASIAHIASGEIMHSVNDPNAEAERLYVAQSAWIEWACRAAAPARPLVVWDVGLGAAHNAMALIRRLGAVKGTDGPRAEIISYEHDLDALRLALDNLKLFPHLRHGAPHKLLLDGAFAHPQGRYTWRLCAGDYHAHYAAQPRPDVIFWDPFSAKVDTPMWSLAIFRALYDVVAAPPSPVELFTYTNSTAVRSSMLAAGFYVAYGVPTGPKSETTVALAHRVTEGSSRFPSLARHRLLDAAWLVKRARSTARFGADVEPSTLAALDHAITTHPQFETALGQP